MDWKIELKNNIKGADEIIEALDWNLSHEEKIKLEEIIHNYPMSIPKYYLSLINKDDPNDPIRKLSVPDILEDNLGYGKLAYYSPVVVVVFLFIYINLMYVLI